MLDQLSIGSWVVIGEHCSVRRAPLPDGDYLNFIFESGGNEFEFALAPGVLRRMVALSTIPPPGEHRSGDAEVR